jgi:hypothetical protein
VRFGCGADLLHVLRAVNSWRNDVLDFVREVLALGYYAVKGRL